MLILCSHAYDAIMRKGYIGYGPNSVVFENYMVLSLLLASKIMDPEIVFFRICSKLHKILDVSVREIFTVNIKYISLGWST